MGNGSIEQLCGARVGNPCSCVKHVFLSCIECVCTRNQLEHVEEERIKDHSQERLLQILLSERNPIIAIQSFA